jgi:Flp pilus assembly protein TadB
MGWLKELPLGFRLYFWLWTLFVPAGVVLLFVGAVVPGLVLLALFVLDQAVFVPLMVARRQREKRVAAEQDQAP